MLSLSELDEVSQLKLLEFIENKYIMGDFFAPHMITVLTNTSHSYFKRILQGNVDEVLIKAIKNLQNGQHLAQLNNNFINYLNKLGTGVNNEKYQYNYIQNCSLFFLNYPQLVSSIDSYLSNIDKFFKKETALKIEYHQKEVMQSIDTLKLLRATLLNYKKEFFDTNYNLNEMKEFCNSKDNVELKMTNQVWPALEILQREKTIFYSAIEMLLNNLNKLNFNLLNLEQTHYIEKTANKDLPHMINQFLLLPLEYQKATIQGQEKSAEENVHEAIMLFYNKVNSILKQEKEIELNSLLVSKKIIEQNCIQA